MTHKVVYNACYGGFSLNNKVIEILKLKAPYLIENDIYRY